MEISGVSVGIAAAAVTRSRLRNVQSHGLNIRRKGDLLFPVCGYEACKRLSLNVVSVNCSCKCRGDAREY
jgi:hypothetical protein